MLKVGDKAPAFTLVDDSGKKVSLKDFKGKKVVLYFYPKDLTPGCTVEACDFRDISALLKKKKAVVLGVSKDSVALHGKFRDKHELNFPLLSDVDGEVCEAYGVWQEKSMYGKKYMGIARTTFIIGTTGKIEKIFERVKVKGHSQEVLENL
ncbi:MAG: thioredoxin-dependent thiol peroxidase [Proteobacteria bacterium]|jgi:peroxiredoxin Q/BCP|nr:thioredoxin-dependent thiol peroxidase [Pseudomonadota bacterium]